MQQSKMLKSFSGLLLVLLTSLIMVNDASAKAEFLGPAAAAGININAGCATCHTAAVGDKNNVKPNYAAAYKLDKTGFSKLANLIKGCPSGQTLNTSTFVCTASAPTPVVCVAPKVRDAATNTCVLPPCPTSQIRNAAGACETPTPTPLPCVAPKKLVNGVCTLPTPTPVPCVAPKKLVDGVCTLPTPTPVPCAAPKKLVNGVCTLPTPTPVPCVAPKKLVDGVCTLPTPVSCNDMDDDDNKSSLKISDPGKIFVHAGRILRVGITVFGDDRKTVMGVSDLPNGARFYDAYNPSLRSQEGVLLWRVPTDLAGKKMKVKLCGKTTGGGKGDSHASRDVKVEVLPPTTNSLKADPVVSANYVTSSVYNSATGKLETSGQITWYWKSTLAERQTAIAQPVELFDAESNTPLGSTTVGLDGRWFISVTISSNHVPRVVDAAFLGRLGTEPVQQSGVSDGDDYDDDGDDHEGKDDKDDKEDKKDKDD